MLDIVFCKNRIFSEKASAENDRSCIEYEEKRTKNRTSRNTVEKFREILCH